MALINGDNYVSGDLESYQQNNRLKNHWRNNIADLTNPSEGMIKSTPVTNLLEHCIADSTPGPIVWAEIVQGDIPISDGVEVIWGDNSDASIQYDEATNDAWIFGVPVDPKRGVIWCDKADIGVDFTGIIDPSAFVQHHIVDNDNDSTFDWGFWADDVGLLTVPANPLREQILFNSGFGVWFQSDANKGLGTLTYDNLTGNFVIGEAVNNVAYISANLAFVDSNPDTITDAGNGFLECQFMAGDSITVAGTVNNDGNYTIATVVAGTITLVGGDALVAEGPVACTITSNTVIATGKVQTDSGTVLVLGACTGRFRDDDGTYAGWIVGATSGATATVNMPTGAVGVDLIKNGEFSDLADDPPPGWNPSDSTLTTEAGGQVGNCMKILATAATGQATQDVVVEPGKIYKLGYYYNVNAPDEAQYYIYDVTSAAFIVAITDLADTGGAWSAIQTFTLEAPAACVSVRIGFIAKNNTDIVYIDEVTLYEITPCCTAGDAVAFDKWIKYSSLDIYRQHWDATYTKDGSFYSLKMVPTEAIVDSYVRFPGADYDNEEWYAQFRNRPVAFGAWVYASKSTHCRLRIIDSVGNAQSSYHSGTPGWEWLEIARIIDGAAVDLAFFIYAEGAAEVDGDSIIYISQPMLSFGASLGVGNYRARQQEFIFGEVPILSNIYDNTTGWSDLAFTDLNLEADSDARIPKGAKAILVHSGLVDSGSGAASNVHLCLRSDAVFATMSYSNSVAGKASNIESHSQGIQGCDANGDVDIHLDASGPNTLDIPMFEYHGIQVT